MAQPVGSNTIKDLEINNFSRCRSSGQLTVKPAEEKSLFHREVFFSAGVLKPLGVGLSLLAFQQISGIDAVIFFTVDIFKSSGRYSFNAKITNHYQMKRRFTRQYIQKLILVSGVWIFKMHHTFFITIKYLI